MSNKKTKNKLDTQINNNNEQLTNTYSLEDSLAILDLLSQKPKTLNPIKLCFCYCLFIINKIKQTNLGYMSRTEFESGEKKRRRPTREDSSYIDRMFI